MGSYLVKFTPLEPYFFGNERAFDFGEVKPQKSGKYFIRSEKMPAQTTIWGALRYILSEIIRPDFSYTEEEKEINEKAVGKSSFDITQKSEQDYGKIRRISPVFIADSSSYYVNTPFDHKNHIKDSYSPFLDYKKVGDKLLPRDYKAKNHLADSYVNLDNSKIYPNLFISNVKVVIKKLSDKDGFFKREYKILKNGFSFACFTELDTKPKSKYLVYLGQGKSAFSVSFEERENDLDTKFASFIKTSPRINEPKAYALSDIYITSNIYRQCLLAITKIKEFRNISTNLNEKNYYKRLRKNDFLVKLIQAGSVFLLNDAEEFKQRIEENTHCTQIGLNKIIMGG
ncbi:UNVERIFIED_CONTAM: CRISPR-associated Cmr3 family protein [Acetivibrio alkalicellulosi]